MLRSSQAPQAVASVRDILSRQENLPRVLSRLGQHASHQRTLDHNPPQPTKRSLDPLIGNLASREFTYPDGSVAVLQHQLPDTDNLNRTARIPVWIASSEPRQPAT